MPQEFHSAQELAAAVGKSLGASDWLDVEQQRIDRFADATDDHQWIHIDVPRATAGPFANTIAHGYLTLSLVNALLPQLISVPSRGGRDQQRLPQGALPGAGARRLADPRARRSRGGRGGRRRRRRRGARDDRDRRSRQARVRRGNRAPVPVRFSDTVAEARASN